MIVTKLLEMFALFILVGLAAATPLLDVGDSSVARCEASCRVDFTSCLGINQGAEFCRKFVCDYYGTKCQACEACRPGNSYRFIPAVDAAGESSSEVVKRETQEDWPHCIFCCNDTSCSYKCPGTNAELPEDLNGTLVIGDADLINGTVAIKIDSLDESLAGEQRRCIHWVCVFRNCYYAPCKQGAQADEIAQLATLETMAGDRDNQTEPEDCRKVCNDDADMCITLCAPTDVDMRSAGLAPRINCEQRCMGKTCWTVCYPPYTSTEDVEKREAEANLTRRWCREDCWAQMCWFVCYLPYGGNDGVEDAVDDGVARS
ncbi:Nn.00g052390.m01.CDS01 [Neocucurbitaria sp. VM-36]